MNISLKIADWWLTTLDRYLLRVILNGVLLVMAVLLALGGVFLFMEQQNDIGIGNYGTLNALSFVVLNLPQQVWELLPISALMGALLGLGNLSRGSELLVMRSVGLSVWNLARAASYAGLVLVLFGMLLVEVISPSLQQMARQQKAFSKYSDISFNATNGAWFRDGNMIINIERQMSKEHFSGMRIYELHPDHRLLTFGHATTARTDQMGKWHLEQYVESQFTPTKITANNISFRELSSNLTADFLGIAATAPYQLSSSALRRMIQYLESNNLDAHELTYILASRLARTLAPLFAVLLALPFVFGALRSSGAGAQLAAGLGLGVVFFILQRLVDSSAFTLGGSPWLLASMPTILMAIASLTFIARTR